MIKKISLEELATGMYVCGMEKGSGGAFFFMNNILLKTRKDIEKLCGNGYSSVFIVIDEEPSEVCPEATVEAPALEPVIPAEEIRAEEEAGPVHASIVHAAPRENGGVEPLGTEPTDFEVEIKEAEKIRNEAEGMVREFLSNARSGGEIDPGKVAETVNRMVCSVFRNQDALTSLARLKSFDDYTFAHSVNVCILTLATGRLMGFGKEELSNLGVGAVLHDIGKVLVPGEILNKPGKLSDDEFATMKRHAELGAEFLSGTKGINEECRLVALEHHERIDGCGYGRRLTGDRIHLFARIVAVADVYDAMTSNRVYQKGMAAEDAVKRLYMMRGTHFEPALVERLIKCLGVYPIGTLVELNTGEMGVVKVVNSAHPLQPKILILSDKDKRPIKPVEADLKEEIGRWIVGSKKPEDCLELAQATA